MHAYVLGRTAGEPAWHMVGQGEAGNRVRAIARLDGAVHNVFAALEAPDATSMSTHVESLTLNPTEPVPTPIVPCDTPDCCDLIPGVVGRVSFIGESDSLYAFGLLDINGPVTALRDVVASMGADRVAAITDGKRVLVELVGTDRTELEQEMKRITSCAAVTDATVSFSEGITRAAP